MLTIDEFRALDAAGPLELGQNQAEYLLGFSLLAPSSHNTVPLAYRIDVARARIELWLRRSFVLPASDPTGKEALISTGCALENLSLAAAQYGMAGRWHVDSQLSWELISKAQSAALRVGHLQLDCASVPNAQARRAALECMVQRRTVRAEFDPTQRIPPALRDDLERAASESIDVRLSIFESAADKFAWGKLDELATKHKLEERAFRHELGRWMLPNDDERSTRGMRGREFGLEDRLSRDLPAQLRDEQPIAADQLTFMSRAGRIGLCSSSAVCVLSGRSSSVAGTIDVGRAFQRCWLHATLYGFCAAVHTAICHVPHVRAMSSATLMKSSQPDVIFRLGKPLQASDAQRAHSSRPRLQDLLLDEVLSAESSRPVRV
ncbi:MAG TPA: hypothetical protein VFS67_30565 [Polyangiaceae bacterium]|nr:hypothetical protein [Polyangiaceae bacterium]